MGKNYMRKFLLFLFILCEITAGKIYGESDAMGGEWFMNPPSSGGESTGGESSGGEQSLQDLENGVSEETQNVIAIEKMLEALEKQYAEIEKTIADMERTYEFWKGQYDSILKKKKEALVRLQSEIDSKVGELMAASAVQQQALSALLDAYQQVSDSYGDAGVTGDPVNMSSGDYICSNVDYVAEDFGDVFTVNRDYVSDSYSGSLGRNWNCSLDSRIIRGSPDSVKSDIATLETVVELINGIVERIEEFRSRYFSHYRFDEEYETALNNKEFYEGALKLYKDMEKKIKEVEGRNKYVLYGKYKNKENRLKALTGLVFIDEDGREYVCENKQGNLWSPLNPLAKFYIEEKSNKEYEVIYVNGEQKFYNEYGLLKEKQDRNGNKTIFTLANGKITGVKLKTGEELKVARDSSGRITNISGSVSGQISYEYSGSNLKKVIDKQGNELIYDYNSSGELTRIQNADKNPIVISYEYSGYLKKNVVSAVSSNSETEYFEYDFKNKKGNHTDIAGNKEWFCWNEKGQIVSKSDDYGRELDFTVNEKGLITDVSENSKSKSYLYDEKNNPVAVCFTDGTKSFTDYDQKGNVIHQSDRDGFYNDYVYDQKGNLVEIWNNGFLHQSIAYFDNGLMKTLQENGNLYEYEYNNFGSITKRICHYSGDVSKAAYNTIEEWVYDSKNRLIEYADVMGNVTSYSYGESVDEQTGYVNSFRIENYANGLKIKSFYDSNNREVRREETDKNQNKTIVKETAYNDKNQIALIKIDGKPYVEYFYNTFGNVEKYYVWELKENAEKGVLTEYEYDSLGRKITEIRSKVYKNPDDNQITKSESVEIESFIYSSEADSTVMTVKKGSNAGHKYYFDSYGRLVKILRPDGGYERREYTSGGKLKKILNHRGKYTDFSYLSDGTTVSKVYSDGICRETKYFNTDGLILKSVDGTGVEKNFSYDGKGYLIEEIGANCRIVYERDILNRVIKREVYDKNNELIFEKHFDYDDIHGEVTVITGDKYYSWNKKDVWGRVIAENSNGVEISYEYDSLGQCISADTGEGYSSEFAYDLSGNLLREVHSDSSVDEYEYNLRNQLSLVKNNGRIICQKAYDDSGNLIWESDLYNNKKIYNHDSAGNTVSLQNSENGLLNYSFGANLNKLITTNSSGTSYEISFNGDESVTEEKDFSGAKTLYEYDYAGRLLKKLQKDGSVLEYEYSTEDNRKTVRYSNGESYWMEKNPLNLVSDLNGESGELSFTYDLGGKLVSMKDCASKVTVEYEYDKFGRCVEKKSSFFDFAYVYNKHGLVEKVEDLKSGTFVKLEYDVKGREIKRVYSNNVSVTTRYSREGFIESVVSKEPYGIAVCGEFAVYDSDGRLCLLADEKGAVRRFSYDTDGRLSSVEYPYDERLDSAYDEAVVCGIAVKDERPAGVVLGLTEREKQLLEKLAENAGVRISVDRNQYCWKDCFEYSDNGSVSLVKNHFGAIKYSYDADNRLLSKTGSGKTTGEFYVWSKNGNLASISNEKLRISFSYGALNRPVLIQTEDFITGESKTVQYEYDSIGRRISEIVQGGTARRFVYDGLSTNLLAVTPVFGNGTSAASYAPIGVENLNNGTESYRYLDSSEYEQNSNVKGSKQSTNYMNQNIELDTYAVMNVNSSASVYIYKDSATLTGYNPEFVMLNGRNTSALATTDYTASCNETEKYDVWGVVLNDKGNSKHKSYSGSDKSLNINYQIYDLGLRDYIPSMRSFISEDPAKAGGNWYAYCSCDPVNYSDTMGLYKNGMTEKQKADYAKGVFEFLGFTSIDYKAENQTSSAYVPRVFDCADTSAWIDYKAAENAGIDGYSTMASSFKSNIDSGNQSGAQNSTSSSMYWTSIGADGTSAKVTLTHEGWDSDQIKNGKEEQKAAAKQERSNNIGDLRNPDNVTPGSVLVWKKTELSTFKNWIGHTGTVLSRTFDADGNITGICVLEGHSGGGKTALEYYNLLLDESGAGGDGSVSFMMGDFLGIYEICGSEGLNSCGN